jgi:hypothetical protein
MVRPVQPLYSLSPASYSSPNRWFLLTCSLAVKVVPKGKGPSDVVVGTVWKGGRDAFQVETGTRQ